jgi:pimeloyl-ACP methyl ester carboxylesterase
MIGHSLGGTLARAAAVRRPDLISQVICLGSPIAGSSVHPLVVQLARAIADRTPTPNARPRAHGDHYHDGTCACDVSETLAMPLSPEVTLASIFSETDGVVDWSSSQVEPPATNIKVKATHLGLPFNVEAYRAVAWLLSNQEWDLTPGITSATV